MNDDPMRDCTCCGAAPGGVPSHDANTESNEAICAECKRRGRERVGVDYDLAELGGEA